MRTLLIVLVVAVTCLPGGAQTAQAPDARGVLGTWEGESKCTVPNSPCRDEHVIYRIAEDQRSPGRLTIDADKVVNGKNEYMGRLECEYRATDKLLRCTAHTPRHDDWQFTVSGDSMTGTLTVDPDKTLYRRISVQKKKS
jgi:hypothetical protein